MFASVPFVDILEHLFPVAMREVEIDVGRFLSVVAQESFEEQFEADRIDRRDAEAVADGGVGGRSASLAQDPFAACEAHDIPHDEEVAGESEP